LHPGRSPEIDVKTFAFSAALRRLLLLATLATPCTSHAIEWQAEASLQNLTFTLIDLDPLDGIAPALVFNQGFWLDVAHQDSADQTVAWQQGNGQPGGGALISATALGMITLAQVSAGAPYGADAWARFQGQGPGTAVAQAYLLHSSFSLTPHTQLVATAQATTKALGRDAQHFTGAGAQITFQGPAGLLAADRLYTQVSPYGDLTAPDRAMWVSLQNDSPQALTGELYAGAWASSVNLSLSPVPEPGTASLWLVAAAAAAGAAQARKRRAHNAAAR
jgi:hypothetical protein